MRKGLCICSWLSNHHTSAPVTILGTENVAMSESLCPSPKCGSGLGFQTRLQTLLSDVDTLLERASTHQEQLMSTCRHVYP